ncbi:MAG: iron ABC transporter permease [Ferruginibacter sp.]|nr:iron ABC transporter permease [Ferruginibacter sp.]
MDKIKHSSLKLFVILFSTFFLLGYIIYPLYKLMLMGSDVPGGIHQLVNKSLYGACLNSLTISLLSVIGSGIIGTFFAYTLHFKKIWFKRWMSVLILLPIAIPPMVAVMSYLFLLNDNGLLSRFLGLKELHFTGWKAILTVHLYSFYPLFYLFANNAIRSTDNSIVEASYMLGASKTATFFKVILPQLRPSLIGASILTFMASMASFSAPFIFGGSTRFLTTEIYYAKINGDNSIAAIYALVLSVITLIPLLFFLWYSKKIPSAAKSKGTAKKNSLAAHKKTDILSSALSFLFTLMIMLPVLSIVLISLLPDNFLMAHEINFSLKNYKALFKQYDLIEPFVNSVLVSLAGVLISLVVGISVGNLIRGKKNIFKSVTELVASIPYGIPGTVIGICLILSFNEPSVFSFSSVLVGNFWILPVAYAIRNLPIITQATKAGLQSIDPSLEEASKTMGASPVKTWRSITFPMISPFIIEAALLVFINAFGEFVATILLYTADTKTMPIEIYAQMRLDNNGMAATYGVVLFLIVLGIVFITRRNTNKR